ncbi:MAG: hypothetical protein CIT03_02500 [Methanobacterium sp.]|nr:MAG: hypothetical protein CIT03_02500 [Methanobacterium sp.]
MKANDTQIRVFLEGSKQFIVPLFQREYVWDEKDIERLWKDIEETGTNYYKRNHHFFGSFVTMPTPSGASNVSEFTIVDGQQRLTTIFIILATIRERIEELEPENTIKDEIDDYYLLNKHHTQHKFKLLPTQKDRNIFFRIMEGKDVKESDDRIFQTYTFFKGKLEDIVEIEELNIIKQTILSNFSIVDIALEERDDPYLIFETLNGTGVPLTQSDLVRNYLFMKLNPKNQQESYKNIWLPLEKSIKGEKSLKIQKKAREKKMDNFMRHYLAMDGDLPTFNKIYITLKEFVDKNTINENGVIKMMEKLKRFSQYYSKFLYPKNEKEMELSIYFDKFNRLNSTTPYPLLLKLYDDYQNPNVDFYIEDLIDCLHLIETFVVRRSVCGIPVNALNTYFPRIYSSLDNSNLTDSLKEIFINGTGTQRMPDKTEFRRCLKEGNSSRQVNRYILEEIEKYPDNKEIVKLNEMQLEHIMPQTINKDWKKYLGDNWESIHNKYLESIGNLTLTGYNQEYSNKTFEEKREMKNGFRDSGLKLNRHLSQQNEWGEKQIRDRSTELAKIATNIWDF